MFRATISHRSRILAGGVCALLAVALATATASGPAASASTDARTSHGNSPAAAISPGHWAQVTAPLPNNPLIPEIGLARGSDGVLHVLWTTGGGTTWHVKD